MDKYIRKGDTMSEKLSHEEFVKKAIVSLRKEGFKGIHTVYSGFNNAFKKYFDGLAEQQVDFTYRVKEMALFYYTDEANLAGTFIN